ncbi:MAG: CHASE2 domain-containing protein, partial [Leptolyngbyaceae bacterium]|nr:CHASE2 domain-containing protein [Leptolyngbyaceae bacterium]
GRDLADLNIPQLIVMREPIADQVAQAFLKQFLKAFSTGQSFYSSVRQAREQLQGLEGDFPGASWLPVIFQNPAETPMQWPQTSVTDDAPQANRPTIAALPPPTLPPPAPPSPAPSPPKPEPTGRKLRRGVWMSFAATVAVMGIRLTGVLQPFELAAYDQLMRSRPKTLEEPIDPHLLVIEVTEDDTKTYGYPLDDDLLARAIAQVQQHNPRVLGIDMHRAQPRGAGREELIAQFEQHPNLFTVCSFDRGDRPIFAPPAEFSPEQRRNQVGFSDIEIDGNENTRYPVARRQLLTFEPTVTPGLSLCTTPYSFSFHLTYAFLKAEGVEPLETVKNDWQFGDVVFRRLPSRMVGYQDLDGQSSQILLNYRFNERPARRVTLTDILDGSVDPELITHRIVLMGTVDEVGLDEKETPYGAMPGVWVHTHMVSQMVEAVLNGRSLIWGLPQWGWVQWGDFLFVWAWAMVGGLVAGVVTMYARQRWALILSGGVIILVMYYTSLFILLQGGWVPLLPALLAFLMTLGIIGFYGRPKIQ